MTDKDREAFEEFYVKEFGVGSLSVNERHFKTWQAARDHFAPKQAALMTAYSALENIIKEEEKDFLGDRDSWIQCASNMKQLAEDGLAALKAAVGDL
jgi:hypothetical protein